MKGTLLDMNYLLGIDFGGGSAKATLIDTDGKIVAEAGAEYPTYHNGGNGCCEQSPEDWRSALSETCLSLLAKSGIDPQNILAIALDSATHTAVLLDESCRPLRNALHWTDSRSFAEAAELRSRAGEMIFDMTYHKPDTIWTIAELLWIKNNEPEVFSAVKHLLFEKDYLRFLLSGVICTDFIEAQGSMLFDIKKREWSPELCSLIGLDISVLPRVVSPADIIGAVTKEGASITGLAVGTPIICGTTDTALEVFASGAVSLGDTTVKLATAGRICVITDKPYPDRDVVNYSHIIDGLWYPGSATKAAASSLRWYRDTFGGNYRELDEGAECIPVGADGLIFSPYINGELTPYADPSLCASFIGIRSGHTKAHFTRSVLEGVALSLLHSKKKLESLGIKCAERATLIGGGAKSPLWQSIISDCLGIELSITESSDSSLGSAMLAGLAVGVFKSPAEAAKHCIHVNKTVHPCMKNHELYQKLFEEYVRVHDALEPIYSSRR